jgi:hypothetical protein
VEVVVPAIALHRVVVAAVAVLEVEEVLVIQEVWLEAQILEVAAVALI